MTANIKYFDSAKHTGLTAAASTAGNLIAFLDAALVNGCNAQTLQSIAVSEGIATATSNNHNFQVGMWVLIAGANEAQFNREFQVVAVPDANTFTFAVPGAPASATGTVTVKQAPLGWDKAFSGTNLAAYRSTNTNPGSRRHYLRVDDTNMYGSWVWGAESMTGISAGANIYPGSATSFTNTCCWSKAYTGGHRYMLVGDDKRFWLFTYHNSYLCFNYYYFGDFTSLNPAEAGNVMLIAETGNYTTGQMSYPNFASQGIYGSMASSAAGYLARTAGGAVLGRGYYNAMLQGQLGSNSVYGSTGDMAALTGSAQFMSLTLQEVNPQSPTLWTNVRGYLNGLLAPMHRTQYSFTSGAFFPLHVGGAQRVGMAVMGGAQSTGALGIWAVDMTGPWD